MRPSPKTPTLPLLALSALALGGCSTVYDTPVEEIASARLSSTSGEPVGTAEIMARGDQITLSITAAGLTPGQHGFHLHQTGACKAPDFSSAGGHLNPLDKAHGLLAANGHHIGDLPNLEVSQGGTASLTTEVSGTRQQVMDWLFDADGTALVIHAGPDDYRTNPSGNAGGRVACGVLMPVR